MLNRFEYHPPKNIVTVKAHEMVREAAKGLALAFENLVPDSREKSLALTKIEEAMFWANAGIARSGSAL
ncbi:hypothetical protein GS454_04665 [Rhodococcus hoagii]|nr:hypothetical protein [Prescottella equi]